MLRQIRQARGLSPAQVAGGLPGISEFRYLAWERDERLPPFVIQTLVIWRLNTGSKQDFAHPKATQHKEGLLATGFPARIFAATAILVTLFWLRAEPHHLHFSPNDLAEHITESAHAAGFESRTVQQYMTYAEGLATTLEQFTPKELRYIVSVAEELP